MRAAQTLAIRPSQAFQVPALIADVGPEAAERFFEFFTVPIRNQNTRAAYYHAIRRFLDWCDRGGLGRLADLRPVHVAAYVEQHPGSPATVKQHLAAIRMLLSWMTEKGVLAMNPGRTPTPRILSCVFYRPSVRDAYLPVDRRDKDPGGSR